MSKITVKINSEKINSEKTSNATLFIVLFLILILILILYVVNRRKANELIKKHENFLLISSGAGFWLIKRIVDSFNEPEKKG